MTVLHFQGVAISDWQDIENLQTKYHVAATYEDGTPIKTALYRSYRASDILVVSVLHVRPSFRPGAD